MQYAEYFATASGRAFPRGLHAVSTQCAAAQRVSCSCAAGRRASVGLACACLRIAARAYVPLWQGIRLRAALWAIREKGFYLPHHDYFERATLQVGRSVLAARGSVVRCIVRHVHALATPRRTARVGAAWASSVPTAARAVRCCASATASFRAAVRRCAEPLSPTPAEPTAARRKAEPHTRRCAKEAQPAAATATAQAESMDRSACAVAVAALQPRARRTRSRLRAAAR